MLDKNDKKKQQTGILLGVLLHYSFHTHSCTEEGAQAVWLPVVEDNRQQQVL